MSVFAKGTYFWRSAAGGVRHAPFIHAIAVTTLALALFALGLARGAGAVLDALLASLGGEVEVTAYLQPGLPPEALEEARARAEALSGGGRALVVTPAEALARLARELGDMGEALSALPDNPLPPSLELSVPPARRTPEALGELAAALRAQPGVTAVDYGEAAVARLSALARAARLGGAVAFALVAFVTVVVVGATLQLGIYARREEIEIQKLVGATDRFVKAPFLIEGLLQGLLGAGVALLALALFARVAAPQLAGLFAYLLGPAAPAPAWLTPVLALELAGAGCVLGLCGSFLAVGRFLRA